MLHKNLKFKKFTTVSQLINCTNLPVQLLWIYIKQFSSTDISFGIKINDKSNEM